MLALSYVHPLPHMTAARCFTPFLFALLLVESTSAQVKLWGKVTDSKGEDLAFVSVLLEGSLTRTLFTDIEGKFSVNTEKMPQAVTFRYVGYETLRLDAVWLSNHPERPLHITLQEAKNELDEVEIRPGENPADRIIRNVVANRDRHNPERCRQYTCTIYGKQSIQTNANWRGLLRIYSAGRDSSLLSLRNGNDSLSHQQRRRLHRGTKGQKTDRGRDHDDLLMESVVKRSFIYPDQVKQEVAQNRVSGFQHLPVAAIADLVQPFSFYRDYIALIDKAFVNPISPNSPDRYFFNLEDTLYQGLDTVLVISFQPHRGQVFDALKGTLYVNTSDWALQNVRAEPANRNSNLWLKIEQQYARVLDTTTGGPRWFPEQLNFELAFGDAAGLQLSARGSSRISAVNFHPALRTTEFDPETPVIFLPQAETRTDSNWVHWHTAYPLTQREQRTFSYIDSLGQRRHFNRIEWVANIALAGVVPAGKLVSFDVARFVTINDFETLRLGGGLTTAEQRPFRLPHRFDAAIWAGYGLSDQRWKYGGTLTWRMGTLRNTAVAIDYRQELVASGDLEGWLDFRGGFDGAFYAKTLNRLQEMAISLRAKPLKGFSCYFALRQQTLTPTYAYAFKPTPDRMAGTPFQFLESIVSLRYAWGELANETLHADWQLQQRAPVLELTWMHGWNGLTGGQYGYDRFIAALYQTRFIRRLGKMTWRLEAGMVQGNVPFPKLFSISQPGGGGLSSAFTVANTIQTVDTLVISDRFLNLFFTQKLGNVLYRERWSAPYLSLLQNAAWGNLRHPERQQIAFRVLTKPLFESGIRLDDLLRLNVMHFGYLGGGAAVFYGWGPYAYSEWWRNVAVRAAVRWSF